ncbi:unnamed protein product [Clonostachys byssicola]|uniref:BZIP domain-containing protein n=1 Tax=Clonostachys byssicola TaxID=160290 RepID=A0A9N9UQU7_9HYPO|nr:unnamed protein product [Clonostachys byssicola]
MPSPRSTATHSQPDASNADMSQSDRPGASTAAARRAKKREQDRRCQRLARERTKNRISYLEGLVAELRQEGTNQQLQALWKQCDELVAERDAAIQSLSTIERSIVNYRQTALRTPSSRGPRELDQNQSASLQSRRPTAEIVPNTEAAVAAEYGPSESMATMSPQPVLASEVHQDLPVGQEAIIPAPIGACHCSQDTSGAPVNLWRAANEILSEPLQLSFSLMDKENSLEHDAPVRAVVEGWDSLVNIAGGKLPPSWEKLRQIDELLFSSCGNVERLAILRLMNELCRYHQERSPERQAMLPSWYLARPSQKIAHSYAIDYFSWPGLRERFVFEQHRYCTNRFWKTFSDNLRILWPFEFRDCFSRNVLTGQYSISPAFQERIDDIRSWTMSSDMFNAWPEFLADIPVYNPICLSLPTSRSHLKRPVLRNRDLLADRSETEGGHTVPGAEPWLIMNEHYTVAGRTTVDAETPCMTLDTGFEGLGSLDDLLLL